ncbi:MAG: Spy/CpxP family protein refolding chaperone [Acidobacteriota bacterium]|nr:Spy/CpxP family protein refolding chaperone [Acidobacteriota bacterium]
MRRKIAIGILSLMVLLAAAVVTWAEEGAPQGGGPGQGQHQFGGGGQHPWGNGPHQFAGGGPGRFGGPGERGMGWQRGGGREFGGGMHLLRMAENPRVREMLGLTDEQVGRLHKLGVESEKTAVQTRADMELRHIELRELMKADNPDHDAIMQKLDEVNALRGKMEKQHVETLLSARSVLTPEQLKKVKAFMENRGAGGGPGREHMMMDHRGGQGHPTGHPGGHTGPPAGSTPKSQEPPVQ